MDNLNKRIIKFRVWIKQTWDSGQQKWVKKKMLYNAYPFIDGKVCLPDSGIGFANEDEFELMQFTGLKDGKGTDIYEGDYVSFQANYCTREYNGDKTGVITWNYDRWEIVTSDYKYSIADETDEFYYKSKVIGNIFENENLIK